MLILFRNSKFTKTTKHTKKLLIIASSKQNMSSNLYNSSSNNTAKYIHQLHTEQDDTLQLSGL